MAYESQRHLSPLTPVASMLKIRPWPIRQKQRNKDKEKHRNKTEQKQNKTKQKKTDWLQLRVI